MVTRFSLYEQDVSGGSLGGETKKFVVTLTPSVPQATYQTGTLTIGCGTGSGSSAILNYDDIAVALNASAPGPVTLAPVNWSVAHTPNVPLSCGSAKTGYEIYVRYSGGSYSSGGVTYDLLPDTWGPVPVVPESSACPGAGCKTISQP